MRTMVEPAATAASRSSLMPMERSSRPSPSANRPTVSKASLAAAGPGAATVMRPRTSRPRSAQTRHEHAHFPRGAAVAAGQPGRVDLHEDPGPRGEAGDPRALGLPGHALPQTDERGQLRHLVPLHRAEEVPDDLVIPMVGRRLLEELRRVVLAQVRQPRPARRAHRVGTEPLGDRDHPDPGRIPAGALDPLPDRTQPVCDLVASGGRRGRRNRRHPGRDPRPPSPWRRRRCPPARAWRRSSRPGRPPCWRTRCPPPSARSRRR